MINTFLRYIFIVTLLTSFSIAEMKKTITLAPLPIKNTSKSIQDFLPLNSYLEETLDISVKSIYKTNYLNTIDSFIKGEIDIAYLGPLTYKALQLQYPHIKPIASIKEYNGTSAYRCALTKFKKDTIDRSKPLKVALTQPLSTCGYYMADKLIKEHLKLELKKQKFTYLNSHTNAILSVASGDNTIALVKDTVAISHQSIGMEVIAQSEELPGLVLVANTKTLTKDQINLITQTILSLDSSVYSKWSGLLSKGFKKVNVEQYDSFKVDFNDIPLEGNM